MKDKLDLLLNSVGDMALKRRARKIILSINPQKNEKILDIGCGDGYYLYLLSSLGISLKLSGTDFDRKALQSAKKNLKGKRIPLHFGDLMHKLPFKANSFDKIIMSEVTEHLPDDIKGLKEVRRVLKNNGTLILTVPNHNYPFVWDPLNWVLEHLFNTHIKSGFWSGLWNQHQRLYTPEQIRKVVSKSGYNVEEVAALTWWAIPFNHNLLHFAARKLYGGNFPQQIEQSVSKFKKTKSRPFWIQILFDLVNTIDKLNDIYQPKDHGVGVFVKARK